MESLWEEQRRLNASVSALRHVLNDAQGTQRMRLSEELTRAEASLYAFYERIGTVIIRRPDVQQGTDLRGTEEPDSIYFPSREHSEGDVGGGRTFGSANTNTTGRGIGGND
jgi:hypothetical protein